MTEMVERHIGSDRQAEHKHGLYQKWRSQGLSMMSYVSDVRAVIARESTVGPLGWLAGPWARVRGPCRSAALLFLCVGARWLFARRVWCVSVWCSRREWVRAFCRGGRADAQMSGAGRREGGLDPDRRGGNQNDEEKDAQALH